MASVASMSVDDVAKLFESLALPETVVAEIKVHVE